MGCYVKNANDAASHLKVLRSLAAKVRELDDSLGRKMLAHIKLCERKLAAEAKLGGPP